MYAIFTISKKQTIFRKLKTDFIAPYYSNVFIKQLLTAAS